MTRKKIVNKKWFCKKHNVWIGENYDCPICRNYVIAKRIKRSSLKQLNNKRRKK